jgi:hypothetical protein
MRADDGMQNSIFAASNKILTHNLNTLIILNMKTPDFIPKNKTIGKITFF